MIITSRMYLIKLFKNNNNFYYIYLFILYVYIYCMLISVVECNDININNKNNSYNVKTGYYKVYSKSGSKWHTHYYSDSEENSNSKIDNDGNSDEWSTPEECARECVAGVKPKICYYHWTFEYYHTLGGACELCQPTTNTSISSDCQCILADGVDVSGIIVANRMYPGPSIQVCLGDFIVVDVRNMIPGNGITIHWHGIYQKNYQYYDGVPLLTQCPITEASTFRYQWRAQNIGSHFWHAHTGLHKAEGFDGAIIIRQPIENEPNHDLYDVDSFDTVILLNDWLHQPVAAHFPGTSSQKTGQNPDNFLINGKGQWRDPDTRNHTTTPLAVFNVQYGLRYRFRIINTFSLECPAELTIENHNLTIIAVDGTSVKPQVVTTITTFSAERVDVILNANHTNANKPFWMQLRGLGGCSEKNIHQYAILNYVGFPSNNENQEYVDKINRPFPDPAIPRGVIFNQVNQVCDENTDGNLICIKDLESFESVHEKILKNSSDVQVLLSFFFHLYDKSDLFRPNTYQRFIVPGGNVEIAATVSGISHCSPPSPLISQIDDIPEDYICNTTNKPARCANTSFCQCTHLIHVPLNAVVDIIMMDGAPNGISHPFHLHGYGYHVMGQGLLSSVNFTESNKKYALEMHKNAYGYTNKQPPTKDTLAVASGGYTIVRFIADNPGWWLYHCHFLSHLYNGMSLVIRVGEDADLPNVPKGFPKCGNFIAANIDT